MKTVFNKQQNSGKKNSLKTSIKKLNQFLFIKFIG